MATAKGLFCNSSISNPVRYSLFSPLIACTIITSKVCVISTAFLIIYSILNIIKEIKTVPFVCSHHSMMQPYFICPPFGKPARIHKPHPKVKFTDAEDERLRELVATYGPLDWHVIADHMENRNARQCRERWRNYLCPEVENGPWTDEEDRLLDEKFAIYGPKWKMIATFFPSRTDINIKSRWQVHLRRANKIQLEQRSRRTRAPKKPALPVPCIQPTELEDSFLDDESFQGYVDAAYLNPDLAFDWF